MPPRKGKGMASTTGKGKGKTKAKAPIEWTPLPPEQTEPSYYLSQLNENQRKAVEFPPQGGLQILAGPGSGKTKVLTTRVAHLIKHHGLDPSRIVVVTFTNKAAREMQKRLYALVGPETASRLVMGTFHALCVQFLRKYSQLINITENWSIVDAAQSDKVLKKAIDQIKAVHGRSVTLQLKYAKTAISSLKSRNITATEYADTAFENDYGLSGDTKYLPAVYVEYETQLEKMNAKDFDDLLVWGYRLLKQNPEICKRFKAVLIDEFQDTSHLQYEIAKLLAANCGHLTIVGDPDQSIYGWRQADVENLRKMTRDFKDCSQVHLVHNYRSTGSIVGAALSIIEEDQNRIKKDLVPVHGPGATVVHAECPDEYAEAAFIAEQILHLRAHTGNVIDWNDFAILVRFHAQSRGLEAALMNREIPYRVADGARFFDRIEIADIIAYLQLLDNPHFRPAIERVINTPRRGIGEKTYEELEAIALQKRMSVFDVATEIVSGRLASSKINDKVRVNLGGFVDLINRLSVAAAQGQQVDALIDSIVTAINYEDYLDKEHGNGEERMRNVAELVRFAGNLAVQTFQSELVDGDENGDAAQADDDEDDMTAAPNPETAGRTPLRDFLASLALSNGLETSDAEKGENVGAVTITTGHSAKGLEWPVVFVPGVEEGKYPAFWTHGYPEQEEEERRLLYVAVTRAQVFCFVCTAKTRTFKGRERDQQVSSFFTAAKEKIAPIFSNRLDKITAQLRADVGKQLGRTIDEAQVRLALQEYARMREARDSPNKSPSRLLALPSASPASPTKAVQPKPSPSALPKPEPLAVPLAKTASSSSEWSSTSAEFEAVTQSAAARPPNRPMADPLSRPNSSPFLQPASSQGLPISNSQSSSGPSPTSSQSKGFRPASAALLSRSTSSNDLGSPFIEARPRSQPQGFGPAGSTLPPSSQASQTNGLNMPETRASVISQAVLVNPEAPKPRGDLLASFQNAEADSLASMRNLANADEQQHKQNGHDDKQDDDETASSSTGTGTADASDGRPKRRAKPREVYDPSTGSTTGLGTTKRQRRK